MATKRQITASRLNARLPRKRGPKGEYSPGSGMDQLILAGEVAAGPIENPERFRQLHQEFRNVWRPVGQMEEVLVEKIAVTYWRMRRVIRSETGDLMRNFVTAASATIDEPGLGTVDVLRGAAPAEGFIDRIVQYEILLERQMYHAVRTLDRLQRIRLGDNSPSQIFEHDGI